LPRGAKACAVPDRPLGGLAERLQPGAVCRREALLDAVEAPLDALPARCDQLDEDRQVVEAGVPLGLELAGQALEPPDREAREPAYLRQLAAHRGRFGLNAFADGAADLLRERRLQLRSEHRNVFEAGAGAVERRIDLGVSVRAFLHGLEPRLGPLERRLLHGLER
jgi:hypothetical protein